MMGWSLGYDDNLQRDVGYGVPAYCDHPDCNKVIDRGLSYVCGGEIFGGEHGCGMHFCMDHLHAGEEAQVCRRCLEGKERFPIKQDHPTWMRWKLRDKSWKQWRIENPKAVEAMPEVLIEHGWWFECHHCGRRVTEDLKADVADDDLDPDDFDIVTDGYHAVYCSHTCRMQEWAEKRANQAAYAALIELFESRFHDCTIKFAHVYGQKLEPRDTKHGGMKCTVQFLFPGAKFGATFEYGSPGLYVAQGDMDAFFAWRAEVEEA